MASMLQELKRRNVFRVAGLYLVVAWLLMQIATILESALKLPDWFDGLVTALVLLGFPVALILAWAFELTPDGVKITQAAEGSAESRAFGGVDWLMIVLLMAVGGLIAFDLLGSAPSPTATVVPPKAAPAETNGAGDGISIAVLPFVDLSPGGDQGYFSDGLAEELLNVLTQVPQLRIAGRTSSFAFKNKNIDLREIAKSLGVNHVLEGSVRKSGDNIRVTAQLIKAEDGFHVFSETYDRELRDVFAVQDEISQRISQALALRLTGAARTRPSNAEAYDLYLRARENIYSRNLLRLQRAESELAQALSLAPEYPPLHAAQGLVTLLLSNAQGCYGERPAIEELPKAKAAFDRALDLDPNLGVAHAGIGLYLSVQDKYEEAAQALRHALTLNPNLTEAKLWLANAVDGAESYGLLQDIVDRDPGFVPAVQNLALHYAALGDRDRLEALLDRAERIPGRRMRLLVIRGLTSLKLNDLPNAYRALSASLEASPGNVMMQEQLGWVLLGLGEFDRAAEDSPPSIRVQAFAMKHDFESMQRVAANHPDDKKVARSMLAILTSLGRYREALDRFERVIGPAQSEEQRLFLKAELGAASSLAYAYQQTERKADADWAIEQITQSLRKYRTQGYGRSPGPTAFEAEYEALKGHNEQAARLIDLAMKRGLIGANLWSAVLDSAEFDNVLGDFERTMLARVNDARAELGWAPLTRLSRPPRPDKP